ncbi:MAG: hypothetical protein ACXVEE_41675 [Polyangiales bacterium]
MLSSALCCALACVQGNETGVVKDNCKIRDCGPVSGGNTDAEEADDTLDFETDPGIDVGPGDTDSIDSATAEAASDVATETGGCTVPAGKTCSTFPQCGCASGQNCEVTADDGNRSCVAAGTKKLNEACGDFGECEKGLSCGLYGLCVPFCNVTADCLSSSMDCRQARVSSGDAGLADIPDYKTCETNCDPINPSKSCGTASCAFDDTAATVCVPAGTGTTFASCKKTGAACAAGYACIGTGDCHRWCRVGFAGDCPGGKACTTFSDHPKLGGVEYGYCAY